MKATSPSTRMSRCERAPMMDSRLVLPEPEGPMSASTSPGAMAQLTSNRI